MTQLSHAEAPIAPAARRRWSPGGVGIRLRHAQAGRCCAVLKFERSLPWRCPFRAPLRGIGAAQGSGVRPPDGLAGSCGPPPWPAGFPDRFHSGHHPGVGADALQQPLRPNAQHQIRLLSRRRNGAVPGGALGHRRRSEEHTSELQSLAYLVCRLLLEKKKKVMYAEPPTCNTKSET